MIYLFSSNDFSLHASEMNCFHFSFCNRSRQLNDQGCGVLEQIKRNCRDCHTSIKDFCCFQLLVVFSHISSFSIQVFCCSELWLWLRQLATTVCTLLIKLKTCKVCSRKNYALRLSTMKKDRRFQSVHDESMVLLTINLSFRFKKRWEKKAHKVPCRLIGTENGRKRRLVISYFQLCL